jgi:putative component of toxin-antitoxin plasmid stabilization module
MVEIRKTDVFVAWLDSLRDIQARVRVWCVLNDWQEVTQVM